MGVLTEQMEGPRLSVSGSMERVLDPKSGEEKEEAAEVDDEEPLKRSKKTKKKKKKKKERLSRSKSTDSQASQSDKSTKASESEEFKLERKHSKNLDVLSMEEENTRSKSNYEDTNKDEDEVDEKEEEQEEDEEEDVLEEWNERRDSKLDRNDSNKSDQILIGIIKQRIEKEVQDLETQLLESYDPNVPTLKNPLLTSFAALLSSLCLSHASLPNMLITLLHSMREDSLSVIYKQDKDSEKKEKKKEVWENIYAKGVITVLSALHDLSVVAHSDSLSLLSDSTCELIQFNCFSFYKAHNIKEIEANETQRDIEHLYAEMLGILSTQRLLSISSSFFAFILKKDFDYLSLIHGIRFLKLNVCIHLNSFHS